MDNKKSELTNLLENKPFDLLKVDNYLNNLSLDDFDLDQRVQLFLKYVKDDDDDVRYYVYEFFLDNEYNYPPNIIIDGLNDTNELIRISTLELIEINKRYEFIPEVIHCLRDKDGLVRRYASNTIGNLMLSQKKIVKLQISTEPDSLAKGGLYHVLYICGNNDEKEQAMNYLIKSATDFDLEKYLTQINAILILVEIAFEYPDKKEDILSMLNDLKNKKPVVSVLEAIEYGVEVLNY